MAGKPASVFLAVVAAAAITVSESMAALVQNLLKNIRKNADVDTEKYRRIVCGHQSFDLFWRAATLAGLERRIKRIGSTINLLRVFFGKYGIMLVQDLIVN